MSEKIDLDELIIPPGRHSARAWINLEDTHGLWFDTKCTIGYDIQTGTHFFQSGREEDSQPLIWIGWRPNEYPEPKDIWNAMRNAGVLHVRWGNISLGTPPNEDEFLYMY